MTRFLLVAAAAAFATAVQAQPPGGEPPNPDTDHDGKVTLAEFKAMEQQRQTRMFARMDANSDGKITQAEMDSARQRADAAGRSPAPGAPGGGRLLVRLDANHDGALTKAEMAAMTEQRFKRADTNNDGWLSKGELLMMRQRMRGGPASQ
jgi:hypothetical protein